MINNLRNKGVDTVKVVGSVLSVLAMVLTLTIVSVNLNKIEYAHAAQYDLMDDSGKYVAPQFSLADITSGVVTITITGISRENAGGSASYSESKYCAIAAGTKPASGAEMNASCSSGIISTNNPTRTFTVNYTPTSTDIDYPIRVYELSANKTWTSDYADIIDYPVVILNLKKYYYTNQTNTNTTAYVDWQFNTSSSYFNAEDGQHTFYCINGVAANNSRCDQVQTFGSEVVQSHADGTFYGWVKGNYDATETVIPPSTSVSISEGDKFRPVFKATAPTFSPTGESASTPAALNFTAMSGQIICMTTDGTDPLMIVGLSGCASPSTSISSPFSSGITPGQSAVQTVKAVAYNSSYTQPNITGSLLASDVVSSTYDFHRNIYFNLNGGSGTTPTERVGFVGSVAPSTVTPTDFTAPTATTTYEFKGFSDGLTAVNPFTEVCSGVLYYDENGAATANTIQAPKNDSLTLFACWLPIPGSNVTGVPATASVAVLDHGVNEVTVTLTAPAQFFTPVGVISANVQYCISDQSDGSNCGAGDGAFVEWRTYGSGISFTKGSNGTSENVLYIFAKDPNSSATLPGSVAYTVNEISYKDLAVGAYSAYTTYGLIGETVHIAPSQTLTLGRTSTRWCDETTCTNFYTSDTDFVISAVGSLALRPEFAPEAPGANPDPDSVTSTPITVSFTTQEAPADAEILYSEDASDITALQSCTNSGNIETYTTPISASITTDVTYYAVTCIKGESGLKKYAIPSQLTTVEYSLNRTIDFDLNG
jgi:hypothetical protein